jgi:hypothetical protein
MRSSFGFACNKRSLLFRQPSIPDLLVSAGAAVNVRRKTKAAASCRKPPLLIEQKKLSNAI